MSEVWQGGQQVRLKNDPGRIGILSGKIRDQGPIVRYHVHFPDLSSWVIQNDLELIEESTNDPYELLSQNKYGRVSDLRRNLTCIQLSGRLANLVYSMDTTNTEFYAYQYKPVLSFLDAQSKGILIADEVGLGKTIEAGLIWTELRARFDARRLMIVCPGMLREKWKDELSFRFGIEASLMNADELVKELQRSRFNYPPGRAIICSYDGLRPPRELVESGALSYEKRVTPRAALADTLIRNADDDPLFDMVIFDEAHKMRNAESATSRLGKLLRSVSENIILLSATPINLHSQDLFQLLNLVDEDTFSNEYVFPEILNANEPLVSAQKHALDKSSSWQDINECLLEAQSHRMLRDSNQIKNILSRPMTDEMLKSDRLRIELSNSIERCNLLSKVITRTRKADVQELRVVRSPHALHVNMTNLEAELYQRVTEIVRRYAVEKEVSEGFLLATPQRQLSSSMYAAVKSWKSRNNEDTSQLYEDFGVDSTPPDCAPLMTYIASGVQDLFDLEELRLNDSKFDQLLKTLKNYISEYPHEQVILFSYFRGTLRYLSERLAEHGIENQILMGGMRETKQSIIDRFKNTPEIKVLLASEVASEGVDLQFCRVLINYDLPWNPMRIEQRIGRIDRHGQKADLIRIFNFCYNETIDQRIYERLFERLNIFERSLGDMEAILGERIGALTKELLCDHLTREQEIQRIEQTSLAIENLRQKTTQLESEASNLIAHSGHILQEVNAAHEFTKRITEQDLIIFVRDYLTTHCQGAELFQPDPAKHVYQITLPSSIAAALGQFVNEQKLYGLTALDKGNRVTCLFKNKVTRPTSKEEVINQTHPLIQFICNRLRDENVALMPLVAIQLSENTSGGLNKGIYAAAVKRVSFEGVKVEERLIGRFIQVDSNNPLDIESSMNVVNIARLEGRDWPTAKLDLAQTPVEKAFSYCDELLQRDYEAETVQKVAENSDRVGLQLASADRHFQRQLASRESAIMKLKQRGNTSLIKATEGQIRKVKERYEQRRGELEARKALKHHMLDVCYLVINVY